MSQPQPWSTGWIHREPHGWMLPIGTACILPFPGGNPGAPYPSPNINLQFSSHGQPNPGLSYPTPPQGVNGPGYGPNPWTWTAPTQSSHRPSRREGYPTGERHRQRQDEYGDQRHHRSHSSPHNPQTVPRNPGNGENHEEPGRRRPRDEDIRRTQEYIDRAIDYYETNIEPVTLNSLLTRGTLKWDIRDKLDTIRDYPNSGNRANGFGIPLDGSCSTRRRVRFVSIGFGNEDYRWMEGLWGPVLVSNESGDIKLKDIFAALLRYFGQVVEPRETQGWNRYHHGQMSANMERAWSARHENLSWNDREYNDTQFKLYRRFDLMHGGLEFHELVIKQSGADYCHLELTLRTSS